MPIRCTCRKSNPKKEKKADFACKVKNSKTNGPCAYKDDLRPVLEKVHDADMVIVGAPVYYNYPAILSDTANTMKQIMGHNELLYICNTYQFNDHSRYDFNLFDEEMKRVYRDEHFEEDLEKAYQLGVRVAQAALGA